MESIFLSSATFIATSARSLTILIIRSRLSRVPTIRPSGYKTFSAAFRVKDNSTDATIKPFAHVLVGVGRTSADLSEFDNRLEDFNDAGFAAAVGGGLDIRLSSRIDLRAIQIDYNPMRFDFTDFGTIGIPGTPALQGDLKRTLNNFRFGVGIVIRH